MKWFYLTLFVICTGLVSCCFFQTSDPPPEKPRYKKPCDIEPIKVAVIDTGIGAYAYDTSAHLCKYGHRDFSNDKAFHGGIRTTTPVPVDFNGHGTNVVGLIEKYAGDTNYCIVVLKYYGKHSDNFEIMAAEFEAIQHATDQKINFINFSGGGKVFSPTEHRLVEEYLNKGGHIIAAAGNEKEYLTEDHGYYPAMTDSRVIVVGSLDKDGKPSEHTNYGSRVNLWEPGVKVSAYGIEESGTSQATAIATGKLLAHVAKKCYKDTVDANH